MEENIYGVDIKFNQHKSEAGHSCYITPTHTIPKKEGHSRSLLKYLPQLSNYHIS